MFIVGVGCLLFKDFCLGSPSRNLERGRTWTSKFARKPTRDSEAHSLLKTNPPIVSLAYAETQEDGGSTEVQEPLKFSRLSRSIIVLFF